MKVKSLTLASMGAAIVASLCCIAPLVAVVLGLGAFGAAAVFEEFRPYLLGITVLLLGGAFYLTYRREKTAACGEGACAPKSSLRQGKLALWLATALVALVAAFPSYSSLVWKALGHTSYPLVPVSSEATLILHVEGMTCGGCAASIESALSGLKGIGEASVSFEEKSATVKYDPFQVSSEQMIQAIEKIGYKATLQRHRTTG